MARASPLAPAPPATASRRSGALAVPQSVYGWLERTYGLDLRSLALFRVALGAVILGDLVWRARDLRAFYTDFGVLPRAVLLDRFADPWYISFHLLSGMAAVQAVMFAVAMGFALALLVGYRTKLATIASWALLISLQNRNPVILQGGDVLLRVLAFWAMFLPLGAHYSVDRALDSSNAEVPQRVFTVGSLTLMVQVASVYWFGALLKSGAAWRDGTAVYYALSDEQFATSAGRFLLHFPHLLTVLTRLTLAIEVWVPILLFVPIVSGPVRTASVVLMAALQAGLFICMHLGHFPAVGVVAAIGLLPTWFWSRVGGHGARRRRPGGPAFTIYYDGQCEFCGKITRILKTLLLPAATVTRPAQDDPQALAEMIREDSWVVVDGEGKRYFRSAAMAAVLRHSIARPLAWVLDRGPARRLADGLYRWVAAHRPALTRLVGPLRYRPLELRTHWAVNVLAAFFLMYVCWWNVSTVSSRFAMPDRYRWIGAATRTDQVWDMFAPYPLRDDGWYVIPGVLRDGTQVDVFRGGPVSFARPSPAEVAAQYRDERWRKYLMNLYLIAYSDYRLYYGRYLCRRWNEGRAENDPELLETFDVYFMMRTNGPPSEPPAQPQKVLLHRHHCF